MLLIMNWSFICMILRIISHICSCCKLMNSKSAWWSINEMFSMMNISKIDWVVINCYSTLSVLLLFSSLLWSKSTFAVKSFSSDSTITCRFLFLNSFVILMKIFENMMLIKVCSYWVRCRDFYDCENVWMKTNLKSNDI